MPLPRFVQRLARNYLQNAHVRILRGFSSLAGGQGTAWRVRRA